MNCATLSPVSMCCLVASGDSVTSLPADSVEVQEFWQNVLVSIRSRSPLSRSVSDEPKADRASRKSLAGTPQSFPRPPGSDLDKENGVARETSGTLSGDVGAPNGGADARRF